MAAGRCASSGISPPSATRSSPRHRRWFPARSPPARSPSVVPRVDRSTRWHVANRGKGQAHRTTRTLSQTEAIALAAHGPDDAVPLEDGPVGLGGILRPGVAVLDQAARRRAVAPDRHDERVYAQLGP